MTELEMIQKKIEHARAEARLYFERQGNLARVLTGGYADGYDVEFPDIDTMHVYARMIVLGRMRSCNAYRLSFGKQLKWVGTSDGMWGMKLADIPVSPMVKDG